MQKKRYLELDLVRGIAIVLMVIYHFFFDLNYFGFAKFSAPLLYWRLSSAFIASLFLLVVGISLSISHSRAKKTLDGSSLYKKYLFRGLGVFSLGILVTLATWLYPHEGFIVFGILHLIGLSIILSIPFLGKKKACLLAGIAFIALGLFLQGFSPGLPWLLWLGLAPEGFYSLDYYPLLPWSGLVLLGLFAGKHIYPGGKRTFKAPGFGKTMPARIVSLLGKYALPIYLLHQPLIVAVLFLFYGFPS